MRQNHLVSEKDLERSFNNVLVKQLPITAALMAIIYLIYTIVHLILLPDHIKPTLALIASLTSLMCFSFIVRSRKKTIEPRYVCPIIAGFFVLALINSVTHLFLTMSPEQTTNFSLIIISAGVILLSKRWYFIIISCVLVSWLYCSIKVNWNLSWIHYSFSIVTSSVISVIVFFTRVKIYTKIESQNKILVQHIVELDKNESLRTAIQKRDDFISLTSHELKTPLTALKLQIQLINSPVMRQNLEPKIINLLKEADKQIDRVNGLVSDLLDLSKISHDKLELRIEKIDLFDLLQDIVSRFSKTIDSNLSIEFSNHQYATGCWDRLRIEQVMNNLLTNAAKYGLGRPIKVYADATEKEVQIQVRDFGIGIAVEDQVRIFGRFERAVGTNAVFGLGLGLYISQKIVHAHQGTIYVTSSLNDGATFFVRLPKTLCQDRGSPLVA